MSKLESLGKFLILTERCDPERVEGVIEALDCLYARWCDGTPICDDEWIINSLLKQKVSLVVRVKDSGFELSYAEERFYRDHPDYCGERFISTEHFLFLVEDHLYEQT